MHFYNYDYDGGNTWNKIDCSKLPEVKEGEASFAASNTNIAFVNNTIWVVTGGTRARVLKSSDKGETWKIIETPIIQGDGPQGIYSVDFYNENIGIIMGGNFSKPNENQANKAITTDGGETWTLVANGKAPNYKSCVQYVPGTKGKEVVAVGKTGVSFSNDGGITWKDISKDSYYAIQFVDKNTAWLSGHQKDWKISFKIRPLFKMRSVVKIAIISLCITCCSTTELDKEFSCNTESFIGATETLTDAQKNIFNSDSKTLENKVVL